MADVRPPRRRFTLFAVGVAVLIVVLGLLLLEARPGVGSFRLSVVGLILTGTLAVISSLRRVLFAAGRRRRAWQVLSVSGILGVLANVWSLLTDLTPLPDDWYTYADPLLLAALVFAVIGLVLFPPVRRRATDVTRMVLDGVVIGGSVLFVVSVTIFPQLLGPDDQSFIGRVQKLALPVIDVLIATLAALLITRSGRSSRVPLVLLSAGFCLYTVSDLSFAVLSAKTPLALGTIVDLGWMAGYLLLGLAARHPTAGDNPEPDSQESSPLLGTVVLFLLFFAATIVSLVQMRRAELSLGVAIVWVIVILAVIGRQIALVFDNEKLRRNLEVLVLERTRELRRITKQRELLLSSVGDGIYGVDVHGLITFVNPASSVLLDRTEADLIGRDAHQMFHAPRSDGQDFDSEGCYITEAIRSGLTATSEEDLYVRGDGSSIAVEVTASPLSADDGISGAVVVFRDVTERREVDRMKSEFVSIVSHELRTPLTSIRGSLGLVSGGAFGELPTQALRMIDIALESSDRLTRLINDILDIERIEAGTMPMNVTVCDARTIADGARSQIAGVAQAGGVEIVIDSCEGQFRADPDRVVQTLINLLGNAIKFSEPGNQIILSARPHGSVVEFSVRDQGRGVPPDKLDAIFSRFTQVDSSDAREKGGTGLGLAISRSIVERLGGSIWVESTVGVGSTFRFTLPRVVDRPRDASAHLGPMVLVCDDDPRIVDVMCTLLAHRGYQTIGVTNGDEAIAIVRGERPAAILLDLSMPGTSGGDVVAALRADDSTAGIPIVIVSGFDADGSPALAASTDGWLLKPVDEKELARAVASAIDAHRPSADVMVVEDDDQLGRVVATLLERRGLRVTLARGQQEAVRLMAVQPPQVLILDLNLAEGSGFDLVSQLRAGGRLAGIPLIVYSALDVQAVDRARLVLGDTVFLTKGRITPQELERRVITLVDQITGHGHGRGLPPMSVVGDEPDELHLATSPRQSP